MVYNKAGLCTANYLPNQTIGERPNRATMHCFCSLSKRFIINKWFMVPANQSVAHHK